MPDALISLSLHITFSPPLPLLHFFLSCDIIRCKRKVTAVEANNRQIIEGSIWKQLLLFFFPILMGTFFQQLYNTADTVIVGQIVGTTALAAVGSTGALVNLVNGFFIGIGSGAAVILSQHYGAQDADGVHRTLHTGIALSAVLGLAITVIGVSLGPVVLRLMNTPEDCFADASAYIRIYFCGAVGSMVYNMGAGILRAMGDSRRPMVFVMLSCAVNIVLDFLFVVVWKLGVVGAAAATALSQFISAGMLLAVLLRLPETPLDLKQLHIDSVILKGILRIGLPAGLQLVTFDFSNILIQSTINSFGSVTMAGWTGYTKTDTLTWMVSGAFGVSITTFVGQNFGAQKYKRIRQSVWTCMAMSVGLVGVMSFVMYTFRMQILGIYSSDAQVIAAGAYIMSVITPFNAVFMPVEVFAGTMRGTGYSVMPAVITGTCACLFRIIWIALVVSRFHAVRMLALCYPISWALSAAVFYIAYLRGTWLTKRIHDCGLAAEGLD